MVSLLRCSIFSVFTLLLTLLSGCEKGESDEDLEITALYPEMGVSGTVVSILGKGLGYKTVVRFNGVFAPVVGDLENGIQVEVPDKECSGPITVQAGEQTLTLEPFTYLSVEVSTFAGDDVVGFGIQNTIGAPSNSLEGISVDSSDNVYVSDFNNTVKITQSKNVSTVVSRKVPSYKPGSRAYDSDGVGYLTSGWSVYKITSGGELKHFANINQEPNISLDPGLAITVDIQKNIYVGSPNFIYKISNSGQVSKFAKVAGGRSLAADRFGNIYSVDHSNHSVHKITSKGVVSVFLGGQQGNKRDGNSSNPLNYPEALATDRQGNIYLSDGLTIKMISPSGMVCTIAGGDECGKDDGDALTARFCGLGSLALDKHGDIYAVDRNAWLIRKITVKKTK